MEEETELTRQLPASYISSKLPTKVRYLGLMKIYKVQCQGPEGKSFSQGFM